MNNICGLTQKDALISNLTEQPIQTEYTSVEIWLESHFKPSRHLVWIWFAKIGLCVFSLFRLNEISVDVTNIWFVLAVWTRPAGPVFATIWIVVELNIWILLACGTLRGLQALHATLNRGTTLNKNVLNWQKLWQYKLSLFWKCVWKFKCF